MCGIAGYLGQSEESVNKAMIQSLAHRGPDAQKSVALKRNHAVCGYFGHSRLRVIDLSNDADQPYYDCGKTIVFNGEIYNFRSIRNELKEIGHKFKTTSDTEVLLKAYHEWGENCLTKLTGMFSFAIWDENNQTLFAARDRLGEKPFYYTEVHGDFVFGSELKALLKYPDISLQMNFEALDDYLTYLYIPAPKTIFKNIFSLPPAHKLIWKDQSLKISRYWECHFSNKTVFSSDDAEEAISKKIEKIINERLYSDVPLGAFLSGGVDSSAIVAFAQKKMRLRTFCLDFGESGYRESQYAEKVAEYFKTNHTTLPTNSNLIQFLPKVIESFDEPFGNPTSLLLYYLCQETKKYVTVAIGGDGGDEAFGGYPRYSGVYYQHLLSFLPAPIRRLFTGISSLIPEKSDGRHAWRRIREFMSSVSFPLSEAYISWVIYFNSSNRNKLYSDEVVRHLNAYQAEDFLRSLFLKTQAEDPLQKVLEVDLQSFLPYNLLQYLDRMSMAHGLELRTPWVDHEMLELMASMPFNYKVKGKKTKILFRKVLQNRVPDQVLQRSKLGLNPPMGIWLRDPLRIWMESILSEENISRRGWFKTEQISLLKQSFYSGHRDVSLHLWALIVLELWAQKYLDKVESTV